MQLQRGLLPPDPLAPPACAAKPGVEMQLAVPQALKAMSVQELLWSGRRASTLCDCVQCHAVHRNDVG